MRKSDDCSVFWVYIPHYVFNVSACSKMTSSAYVNLRNKYGFGRQVGIHGRRTKSILVTNNIVLSL